MLTVLNQANKQTNQQQHNKNLKGLNINSTWMLLSQMATQLTTIPSYNTALFIPWTSPIQNPFNLLLLL